MTWSRFQAYRYIVWTGSGQKFWFHSTGAMGDKNMLKVFFSSLFPIWYGVKYVKYVTQFNKEFDLSYVDPVHLNKTRFLKDYNKTTG